MKSGARKLAATLVAALLAVTVSACGPSPQKSSTEASSTDTQSTDQTSSPTPEEGMLRSYVAGNVFLLAPVDPQNKYCEALNPQGAPTIIVQKVAGQDALFIDRINTSVSLHAAMMALLHPTFLSQSTGMISGGTCYSVDPSWQKYSEPGVGLWLPLGGIKATDISFVNEYQVQSVAGPTQARSYHVTYIIDGSASGGSDLNGITGVPTVTTCILAHDNVENKWTIQGCQSSN